MAAAIASCPACTTANKKTSLELGHFAVPAVSANAIQDVLVYNKKATLITASQILAIMSITLFSTQLILKNTLFCRVALCHQNGT